MFPKMALTQFFRLSMYKARPCLTSILLSQNRYITSNKLMYEYSLLDQNDQKIVSTRQLFGIHNIPKYILRKSSINLYESCSDQVDLVKFIDNLELEDSFTTWFCVTKLHVWILLTRIMNEKTNGQSLRNETISRMWEDLQIRLNKLALINQRNKTKIVQQYHTEFNSTLFALDEGLFFDDTVLAGALWRNFFGKSDVDPVYLELLLSYVRSQVDHLSRINFSQIFLKGNIDWRRHLPLMD